MKKQLPIAGITSELNRSVFFQRPAAEQQPANPQERKEHSPAPSANEQQQQHQQQENQKDSHSSQPAGKTDVTVDVMTSARQDVNLKDWQEIIENTETQNSALRLTSEERYAIEDVVNELRRKYGIKTSMNEVARLGLLLLIADFKQHKKASMIHKIKKA